MWPIFATLRDMVYPPKCCTCERFTINDTPNELLGHTVENICHTCLAEFKYLPKNLSGFYGGNTPKYLDNVASLFYYDDAIGNTIKRFKYDANLHYAKALSLFMLAGLANYNKNAYDLIVPVPLHAKKLKQRKFNQNEYLIKMWPKDAVKNLPQIAKTKVSFNLLVRVKDTKPQAGLNLKARVDNVDDAFCVQANCNLANKRILLIDDIMTTGATVDNCAKALRQAGAAVVDIATIARTMPKTGAKLTWDM